MTEARPIVIEESQGLTFARIGVGALAIGHRPPLRTSPRMREAGLTHIATVLSKTEDPHAIERAALDAGLDWIWAPLGSTKNLPSCASPHIAAALESMAEALAGGGRIYLHCSAGIHRTGMIAAARLFRLGYGEEEARAALQALRSVTATDMGEQRFNWARAFAANPP